MCLETASCRTMGENRIPATYTDPLTNTSLPVTPGERRTYCVPARENANNQKKQTTYQIHGCA